MQLDDYLDIRELNELIVNGHISVRDHNELPLRIFNYTPAGTYAYPQELWPDALLKCRGLIVDDQNTVVAVCQPKFWNLNAETHSEAGTPVVFDKADGSLGIVWKYGDRVGVATRGSFHSEQADWANKFLDERPGYQEFFKSEIAQGATPHVEIVFSENRIVLEYDYEDLILLGYQSAARWHTPDNYDKQEYPGSVVEEFSGDWKNLPDRANSEGYILYYPETGTKYKIKNDWYLELHRAIFNMTPRKIWQHVFDRTDLEFVRDLPNEFQDDFVKTANEIREAAKDLMIDVLNETFRLKLHDGMTRPEYARAVKDSELKVFLFLCFDKVPLEQPERWRKAIYEKVRP